jgi:DNA-binding ferritin-like protein
MWILHKGVLKMQKVEEDIKHDLAERISALSSDKKQTVRAILNTIKRMKEEGKSETDLEVFAKVVELEKVLGVKK